VIRGGRVKVSDTKRQHQERRNWRGKSSSGATGGPTIDGEFYGSIRAEQSRQREYGLFRGARTSPRSFSLPDNGGPVTAHLEIWTAAAT